MRQHLLKKDFKTSLWENNFWAVFRFTQRQLLTLEPVCKSLMIFRQRMVIDSELSARNNEAHQLSMGVARREYNSEVLMNNFSIHRERMPLVSTRVVIGNEIFLELR